MAASNVASLSREEKVEQSILRSLRYLPADVGGQLKSMLSPSSLAIMAASLVALAVAQAFGIGELVDAIVLIAGIGFCGWGVLDGCRDLYEFAKTALNARSDQDIDAAGRYFASAVTKIGVNALMAFLLKKPLKSFREMGGFKSIKVKPGWVKIPPPPAPGTVPVIEFRPIVDRGQTSPYGHIIIDSKLDAEEAKITLDHELVHRFFSPKFGPFRQLRAQVRISGYLRSAMLQYLEEALAESYAQVKALGFKSEGFDAKGAGRGVKIGVRWPISGGYLTIQEASVIRGLFVGVIVVEGQILHVALEPGTRMEKPTTQSQARPAQVPAGR